MLADDDRKRMRQLQDEWLAHPQIKAKIAKSGWESRISSAVTISYADVRSMLFPYWEWWFKESLKELE